MRTFTLGGHAVGLALSISSLLSPRALLAAQDVLPPQIVHEPCEEYKQGDNFTVIARFYDDSPLFDPKVLYRSAKDSNWKSAPFKKDPRSDNFTALISGRNIRGSVEYFIEVFDENGNGPARYGAPDAPVLLRPSPSPEQCVQVSDLSQTLNVTEGSSQDPKSVPPGADLTRAAPTQQDACDSADAPVYCSPWLWIGIGAVVLGAAGTITYLLLRDNAPEQPDPLPAEIAIGVATPSPAALLGGLP